MTELTLRKVRGFPQITQSYQVVCEGVAVGTVGRQRGAGEREFWKWAIYDDGLSTLPFKSHGETADRATAMKRFREAWDLFAATQPDRLANRLGRRE